MNSPEKQPKSNETEKTINQSDERLKTSIDPYHLSQVAMYFAETNDWRAKTETSPIQQKGAKLNADKFDNISKVLDVYGAREITDEKLLSMLEQRTTQLNDRMDKISDKNSEHYIRLEKELQGVLDADDFVRRESAHPTSEAQLQSMNQRLEIAKKEQESRQSQRGPEKTIDMVENKHKELLDRVIKECGVEMSVNIPAEFSPKKNGGYNLLADKKVANPSESNAGIGGQGVVGSIMGVGRTYQNALGDFLGSKGITEAVYVQPNTRIIYENKTDYTEQEEGGFLGFGKKKVQVPKQRQVTVGEKPITMAETTKGGNSEESVKLFYTITPSFEQANLYKDFNVSRGNSMLDMTIDMPKSVAQEILEVSRKNPQFIHELVDLVALKDMNLPEDAWKTSSDKNINPLRPPYEKWREMTGGKSKMYIVQKSEIADKLKNGTPDFDEKFVVEY